MKFYKNVSISMSLSGSLFLWSETFFLRENWKMGNIFPIEDDPSFLISSVFIFFRYHMPLWADMALTQICSLLTVMAVLCQAVGIFLPGWINHEKKLGEIGVWYQCKDWKNCDHYFDGLKTFVKGDTPFTSATVRKCYHKFCTEIWHLDVSQFSDKVAFFDNPNTTNTEVN